MDKDQVVAASPPPVDRDHTNTLLECLAEGMACGKRYKYE
jgi:hypothetical protein